MSSIDRDIQEALTIVQDAWDRKMFFAWFLASSVLLGFRIAKKLGAR